MENRAIIVDITNILIYIPPLFCNFSKIKSSKDSILFVKITLKKNIKVLNNILVTSRFELEPPLKLFYINILY